MTGEYSTDRDFADFLRSVTPARAALMRVRLPRSVVIARAYQQHSDDLLEALRSGSRTRLEAVVLAGEFGEVAA
ncbi:MAG: hypothetical protein ACJLS2_02375 [Microcella pacifica]